MKNLFVAAFGFALLTALAPVNASADQLDKIMASKKLRISVDLTAPPFGMMDASLKPTGSDYEIAKSIAADWGLELVVVETTAPTRIPDLLADKVDLSISVLAITPERSAVIDFTRPYTYVPMVIASSDGSKFTGWNDFTGRSVAVVRSSVQEGIIAPKAQERGFTLVRFEDQATWATAAATGQAPIISASATQVTDINRRNPARPFVQQFVIGSTLIAVGVKKGESRLLEKANQWIDANIASGKLDGISRRFHSYGLESMPRQ